MDFYKVLGISRGCSDAEVATAYRKKALKYHPDKNSGKTLPEFLELTLAIDVLLDPTKRLAYDAEFTALQMKREREAAETSERKKLRKDLEERERKAKEEWEEKAAAFHVEKSNLEQVKRLREEGIRILNNVQKSIQKSDDLLSDCLLVKCHSFQGDLKSLLQSFGEIQMFLPRKTSTIVLFKEPSVAAKVVSDFSLTKKGVNVSWKNPKVIQKTASKPDLSNLNEDEILANMLKS